MNSSQTITVRSEADIIMARLQVRNLARTEGFSVMDQARVSLASSSLAQVLGLGGTHRGHITIERLKNGHRSTGVRVTCTKPNGAEPGHGAQMFADVSFMVDELSVKELPGNDLQVTLVKWRA